MYMCTIYVYKYIYIYLFIFIYIFICILCPIGGWEFKVPKLHSSSWRHAFVVGRLDLLDIDRNNERGGNFMNSSSRFEKQTPFQIAILQAGSAIYGNWQLEGVLWDTVPWPQTSVFPMCCGNCKLNHANVMLKWSTIQSMQTTLGG